MSKRKLFFLSLLFVFILSFGGAQVGLAEEGALYEPPTFPEQAQVPVAANAEPLAYLPLVDAPPKPAPWVDTTNREVVRQYYQTVYLASNGVAIGWTGNQGGCIPGTTSQAFRDAVLLRINYFRKMAGVPAITGFDDTYNSKAQAAALMMSANKTLNHTPPSTWLCYTADGASGAGSSNLALGTNGPSAISAYIEDYGSGNYFVGHRRWVLYPQTQYMGTGDVSAQGEYWAANALWVFDSANMWGPRPTTRQAFVAWPPDGYVPYQVVYDRWSFAYPKADFTGATVTMVRGGSPVSTTILTPIKTGYGENTLVWEIGETIPQPPSSDMQYTVTIQNVLIDSVAQQFTYTVTVFNPTP